MLPLVRGSTTGVLYWIYTPLLAQFLLFAIVLLRARPTGAIQSKPRTFKPEAIKIFLAFFHGRETSPARGSDCATAPEEARCPVRRHWGASRLANVLPVMIAADASLPAVLLSKDLGRRCEGFVLVMFALAEDDRTGLSAGLSC